MKYNIFMSVSGPGGIAHNIPNTHNPVEADNLQQLLNGIELPNRLLGAEVEVISIRVVKHTVPNEDI